MTIQLGMDFIHLDETMDLLQEIMVCFVKNNYDCWHAVHRSWV